MTIRNMMEDIVDDLAREVLKREFKGIKVSGSLMDDLTAYVLNRISPSYFTSERGILHGKLDSKYVFQKNTDILLLIHEFMNTIRERRESIDLTSYHELTGKQYFFPHIIGEVLEESTFSIVDDVETTLLYRDAAAGMIDPGWSNPYRVSSGTRGFFHFWPEYDPDIIKEQGEVPFTVRYSHPKFKDLSISIKLPILDNINLHKSHVIPITLLALKEGEDGSFLLNRE